MKIQILSDLHLDIDPVYTFNKEAEVILLPGDVCNNVSGTTILDQLIYTSKVNEQHLVYTTGNHEYYRSTFKKVHKFLSEMNEKEEYFHWLENDSFSYNGYEFLGCVLWSGFYGYRGSNKDDVSNIVAHAINDFRLIQYDERAFTVDDCRQFHLGSLEWLKKKMNNKNNSKKIVLTHFAPSFNSIHPKYDRDSISIALNNYFTNDMDEYIQQWKVPLWVHGHTHSSLDYKLGETRVVCNPKGYGSENPEFDSNLVLTL